MSDTEQTEQAPVINMPTTRAEAERGLASVVAELDEIEPPQQEDALEPAEPEAPAPDILEELFGEAEEPRPQDEALTLESLAERKIRLPDGSEGTGADLYHAWQGQQEHVAQAQAASGATREMQVFAEQLRAFPQLVAEKLRPFMRQFEGVDVSQLAKLANENPQLFADYQRSQQDLAAVHQIAQEAREMAARQYDEMTQRRLNATGQRMREKVKEWGPDFIMKELVPGLMREYKLSAPEFFDVVNPPLAEMALDALKYRSLKKKADGMRSRKPAGAPIDSLPASPQRRDNPTEQARRAKALGKAATSEDTGERQRAVEQLLSDELKRSKFFRS